MKWVYRMPVLLAVIGAYLNTADLLASFQPVGREWVGWIGAGSLAIGLLVSTEELAKRGKSSSWVLLVAVVGFGFAELSGQILHSAFVRNDTLVLDDTWRWVLSYISPSVPVLVGVAMPLMVRFGGLSEDTPEQSIKEAVHEALLEAGIGRVDVARTGGGAARRPPKPRKRVSSQQLSLGLSFGENGQHEEVVAA